MVDQDNFEFQSAFEWVRDSDKNLFLTGKAGTGKSTFLRHIKKKIKKEFVVLAPTGIAAINVRGVTIHSFFRFPFRPLLPEDKEIKIFKKGSNQRKLVEKMDTLIIDEVSMVRADLMDAIDYSLRKNGGNPLMPFGGKQVILIGDLFQLEPVSSSKTGEREILDRYYSNPFFFSSRAFNNSGFKAIELLKVYRQKDTDFINLLDKIRSGYIGHNDLQLLNQRYYPSLSEEDHRFTITLATRNNLVAKVNEIQLDRLESKVKIYKGSVSGIYSPDRFPADMELRLKEGAQVIFVRNDPEKNWVNGTIGQVSQMMKKGVEIELEDGRVCYVEQVTWENIEYQFDKNEKKITEKIKGTYTQFPLRLAWAITIHKSQGMTFEDIIVDMGRGAFAGGQTYVALSRCTSFNGIRLKTPIRFRDVFIDPEVVEFHQGLFNKLKA